MSLKEKLGETAMDLVKNENVQNKTVDMLGMLFPYIGLRKKAVDLYIDEIENSNLSTDAKVVALLNAKKNFKKMQNQSKVVEIAEENAKDGTNFTESSGVSQEWFDRFMEAASFVSSEEMQLVWGRILANEFEEPGCNPPNMIRILSEFTPAYARAFRTLCSMRAMVIDIDEKGKIESVQWSGIIIYRENEEYMRKLGITFEVLSELETLGVIKFNSVTGYCLTDMKGKKVLLHLNGDVIETGSCPEQIFPVGNVLFTSAGEALSTITEQYMVEGYEELIRKYLESHNIFVKENCSYNILLDGDNVQVKQK